MRLPHLHDLQKRHDWFDGRDLHLLLTPPFQRCHSLVLTTGRSPVLCERPKTGPYSLGAYFVLYTCRSGTTVLTDAIFILAHPLPLVAPGLVPGATGEGKDFLNAGV